MAEEYVYNGTYNFAENRVIDGNELEGLEWVDANGNRIYDPSIENDDGTKGGYTDYATPQDIEQGNNLRNSGETGLEQFNQLTNSELPTTVTFFEDSGEGGLLGVTSPVKNENGELVGFEMVINTTSSKNAAENPGLDFDSEMANVIEAGKLTGDQVLTSVFGHEIEHATRENYVEIQRENAGDPTADREKAPDAVQLKILKQMKNKK